MASSSGAAIGLMVLGGVLMTAGLGPAIYTAAVNGDEPPECYPRCYGLLTPEVRIGGAIAGAAAFASGLIMTRTSKRRA